MMRREFLFLLIAIPLLVAQSVSAQPGDNSSQGLRKFDEYSDVRSNDSKARLDSFAVDVQNAPDARGYIIAYGGRTCPNTSRAHANIARSYLIGNRGLDSWRVVVINGGRRSDANTYTLELWLVPRGAKAPSPTPTLTKRCR